MARTSYSRWDDDYVHFVQYTELDFFMVLVHWNNSPHIDMSLHLEAASTYFIVFGLTRLVLEPMIYHTRGKHAYQYNNAIQHIIGTIMNYYGRVHEYLDQMSND